MLDKIRRGQRWWTWFIVIFVGGVFAFYMGAGGGFGRGRGPANGVVVELDSIRLGVADFQRLRAQTENSLRERMGDQFDANAASGYLDSQTLRSMVESAVMAHSALELGLDVSRGEVRDLIRASSSFRNDSGKFDLNAFESYARWEFGSQRAFLETLRRDLLRQKMLGVLYSQASVSDEELRGAARYDLEEVRLAYVAFDTREVPDAEQPDDEKVQAHLDANRDELRARYDERMAEFQLPERVRARHILIRAKGPNEAALAEARKRAEAVRARIVAGETFEDVAREVSDDPGTREAGGELGFFRRGQNLPALEEAAFALEPGDLSDVIKSDSGFHIVKLEEREPARTRPFDEVGQDLAREELVVKAAEQRAQNLAKQLAEAVRGGRSLEEAARAKKLTLERTSSIKRRPDGFVPGLGASPELLATAFSLSTEAPSSPRVFEVGTKRVLIELLERKQPSDEELSAAVAERREPLLQAERNRLIQGWIDAERERLVKSGDLLINPDLVISPS